jgi:hypothetical protein
VHHREQRHALALPRRHVDVAEAELTLKAVVLADPYFPVDIGQTEPFPCMLEPDTSSI